MEQKFSKIWVNIRELSIGPKFCLRYRKFPLASGTAYSGISGKLDKQQQQHNLLTCTEIFWKFAQGIFVPFVFPVELFAFLFDNFWIFWKLFQARHFPTICLRFGIVRYSWLKGTRPSQSCPLCLKSVPDHAVLFVHENSWKVK